MKNVIVGTAGHIDHGKTSLVKFLTGTDTDRLKEEKQRGITIDIGFANLTLGEFRLGFVDVPGHERFVKNMLAGAHGIDLVVLVIAADEGVMPQTREHLDICRLLRVSTGLTVLTKCDLVEPEWLELVTAETADFLRGSFLENQPIVPVSSRTGSGVDILKAALTDLARTVTAKDATRLARLPIDRVFSVKGFGTVVTGTLVSGDFRVGDEVDVLPGARRARVRGIEVHGASADRVSAGQRAAINLQGVDVADLDRGRVVVPAGRFQETAMLDVEVEVLKTAEKPIGDRARVRFHHGTSEIMARVAIVGEARDIAPGERAFAQLRLEAPVLALPGDRFILRTYSPQTTVAGGTILDALPRRHRKRETGLVPFLTACAKDSVARVAAFIEQAGGGGLAAPDLVARSGESDESLATVVRALAADVLLIEPGTGRVVASPGKAFRAVWRGHFDSLRRQLLDRLDAFHRAKPLSPGMSREEARERVFASCAPEVFRAAVEALVAEKKIVSDGDVLRLVTHRVSLEGEDAETRAKLEKLFLDNGLQGIGMAEAFERLQLKEQKAKPVFFLLLNQKRLVRIGELVLHADPVANLIADVRAWRTTNPTIDVAFFKEKFGLSRKYAIPLLEYLDAERVTRRVGNAREILPPGTPLS